MNLSNHHTPPEENTDQKLYPPEIEETNETFRDLIKFFRDFIIILLIVVIMRSFFMSPFRINGQSMEPWYHDKEYILVDKWSYLNFATHFDDLRDTSQEGGILNLGIDLLSKIPIHIGDPKRGDVVVIKPHVDESREYYIKRVIGVPGDTLRFENGRVQIKQKNADTFVEIQEPYLSPANQHNTHLPPAIQGNQFTVPENTYWVMGDNRENSADSRSCFVSSCLSPNSTHFIDRKYVVGKVLLDLWYFNLFKEGEFPTLGTLKWIHPPRLFDTPSTAQYPELEAQ